MLPPLDLSCLEASAPLARPRAHAVGAEAGGRALVDALGGSGGAAGPSGKASDGPAASSFALPAVSNVRFAFGFVSFFYDVGGILIEIFARGVKKQKAKEKRTSNERR